MVCALWGSAQLNGHWFKWTATKFYQVDNPETWFMSAVPWSKERPEAFAGLHAEHVLVIFDEASAVDDVIWETASGAMTTPGAIWLVLGNPTRNTGRFHGCFNRFKHRWTTRQIDSRTAKMANKKQIQQWVDDYGEDSDFVRVRVRGVFPRSGSCQLISSSLVDEASKRVLRLDVYQHAAKIIGVDVARFGDDQCALIKRQAQSFFMSMGGSFIPAVVGEAARQVDPFMVEANTWVDTMKARIPGLSKDLPVRRDLWGRPMEFSSGLGVFYDAISPIASRRHNPEPIDKEMLRLEAYVSSPKKKVNFDGTTVDLSRFKGAYSRYMKLAGNELKHPVWGKGCMDYLNDVVTGKSGMAGVYKLKSDGDEGGKVDFIRSTIYDYRMKAKKQLMKEYPELREYVEQKKAAQGGKWDF